MATEFSFHHHLQFPYQGGAPEGWVVYAPCEFKALQWFLQMIVDFLSLEAAGISHTYITSRRRLLGLVTKTSDKRVCFFFSTPGTVYTSVKINDLWTPMVLFFQNLHLTKGWTEGVSLRFKNLLSHFSLGTGFGFRPWAVKTHTSCIFGCVARI